ncbi:MAG: ParB/RepB/Spo0J family partition protein [Hyphomicrobiaceae bacterium]
MPMLRRCACASRAKALGFRLWPAASPCGHRFLAPRQPGACLRHRDRQSRRAREPKEQSMTDIIHVPLSKLSLWEGNVRKTDIRVGIEELAASIAAHGLLQSLVVRKSKRGKYGIIAGQRRLLALQMLVKDGQIESDCQIPCLLADGEIDPAELSLAENVVRAPMHPADQFEAFKSLIDDGASIPDVAARFGIAESAVAKRLKLGRLSPVILDAYRNSAIDLEQAQAFAVIDDHAAQERVLDDLPEYSRSAQTIRRYLTEGEVPMSDKRARFVGIDAYRAAGGATRQDLFDSEDGCYLQDAALLDRLVSEKLSGLAADISAEGWSWVDIVPDADYQIFGQFKRVYPDRAPLSDSDQAELDRLSAEYDDLAESDDADEDRLAEVEQRMDDLTKSSEFWPADTLALAGAIISLGYNGEVRIERGLIRKADAHKLASNCDDASHQSGELIHRSQGHSQKLIEDLSAQRSASIGAELMANPDIALTAVVHALALDVFYRNEGIQSCLKLNVGRCELPQILSDPDTCRALSFIEHTSACLEERLPGNVRDLWQWLLKQSCDELLDLLAFIAATSVDAVRRKGDRADSSRLMDASILAGALGLDMGEWFKPTAENYFSRLNRGQILAAIDEATGSHAPALDKLKKSELAVRAEHLIAGTSWLPQPLRAAVNDNDDADATQAAE